MQNRVKIDQLPQTTDNIEGPSFVLVMESVETRIDLSSDFTC